MNKSVRAVALALFGLALSISISATLILAALMLIAWAYESLSPKTRKPWVASTLDWPLFIFFCWAVFTALLHRSTDIWDAVSSQSAILLFYWGAHAADENDISVLLKWFCVGAAFTGFLGLCQHFSGINFRPNENIYQVPDFFSKWPVWAQHQLAVYNDRAMGTRSHPLTYAETFIPAVFFIFSWLLASIRRGVLSKFGIAGLMGGLALVCSGIFFAQGRGVWLGLIVGLGVFGWLQGRRFFIRLAGIFLLLLIPLMMASSGFRGRFMSIVSSDSGTPGDQLSKSIRIDIWRAGLDQIKKTPITGVGYKGAQLNAFDPAGKAMRFWTETHNMFLQNALELGVIGFGLFLWVLYVGRRIFGNTLATIKPAFLAMFAVFLVAGLTETWPRDKEIAMIFWLMVGCAQVLHEKT